MLDFEVFIHCQYLSVCLRAISQPGPIFIQRNAYAGSCPRQIFNFFPAPSIILGKVNTQSWCINTSQSHRTVQMGKGSKNHFWRVGRWGVSNLYQDLNLCLKLFDATKIPKSLLEYSCIIIITIIIAHYEEKCWDAFNEKGKVWSRFALHYDHALAIDHQTFLISIRIFLFLNNSSWSIVLNRDSCNLTEK